MTLLAGRLLDGGVEREGWIAVGGEQVAACGFGEPPGTADLAHDGLIARGLCDLQVNGAVGVEVVDGAPALERIDAALLARGVTSYLPTIVSTEPEQAATALEAIGEFARDPASPVEGAHLEGPFLNPEFRGAHHPGRLRRPGVGAAPYYDDPAVRLVTVAPEIDGGFDLVAELARRPAVTVSLGHSGATAEHAARAVGAGARLVTHVFNAMAPIHHRDPGLAGLALVDDRLQPGVIADGHHIDPIVLRLIARSAGERVILVSDASPAAGAPPGGYSIAGIPIVATPDGRSEGPDGGLAGSCMFLDEAVRLWRALTWVDLASAVRAASERPAKVLGLGGVPTPGSFADLVLLSDDGVPERVLRRGQWVA
jgi:N-acetylglucosamine-6-phosphate deacetylase